MKKKVFIGILASCIMVLSACKPITMEQKQQEENVEKEEEILYDDIKELDFSSGYVQGVLKENLYIDALVDINIPNTLGDYEIYRKSVDENMTEAQYADELAVWVDEYYGQDISVTYKEKPGQSNVLYNGNRGYFVLDQMSSTYFSELSKINNDFPEYSFDYDKEVFDEIINEFLKVMEPVAPENIGEKYICLHWNEEYKDYIREKYGENSVFEWGWQCEELYPEQFGRELTDFYMIRLYVEIEGIKLKTYTNPIKYSLHKGEIIDEACKLINDGFVTSYVQSYENYLDMAIDENGSIIGFQIVDNNRVGEKIRENNIIQPKEMLELFYDSVQNVIIDEKNVIKYMNLNYMIVIEDADENKYRNAYITPVWEIQIYEEGKAEYRVAIYSAVDGTMMQSAY